VEKIFQSLKKSDFNGEKKLICSAVINFHGETGVALLLKIHFNVFFEHIKKQMGAIQAAKSHNHK